MSKEMTVQSAIAELKTAYNAKRKLIERETEDFRFALGEQWSKDDINALEKANIKPITDNRIGPNIHLLTGLERQNRTEFRAFPQGEEDSLKSDIASSLFKDAIRSSDFSYKSSDQFKNGIICGESHLEPYLDYTDNFLNGKPYWRKIDGGMLFPDPEGKEYDFRDARYVYKLTTGISKGDLINLYPEKKDAIEKAKTGTLDLRSLLGSDGTHVQKRDYPTSGSDADTSEKDRDEESFDLIERYYKKWVTTYYIGDKKTGQIQQAENKEKADGFLEEYKNKVAADQQSYNVAIQNIMQSHLESMGPAANQYSYEEHLAMLNEAGQIPPPPPEQDSERFKIFSKEVPEIWCFACVDGISEPLADERAWFYPKWKTYHFVPYYARFTNAPLDGDDRHLLVQGLVAGVKGVQEKHNKAEMFLIRHLNSTANSGWLAEEDSWVNPDEISKFGTLPGVNLEYKKGKQPPQRIFPTNLSTGHAQIAADSVEAIKGALGINADLLATQEGSSQSGRAIALRQKQGLLMVQELFDNLARSRIIAGKFLLSQLGDMYDTETAKKVLGEAWLKKNFPPTLLLNEQTGMEEAQNDPETGLPMSYDKEMADLAIAEVLAGDLLTYDVTVGEAVASETKRMADASEVREIAQQLPGIIPPDILIEESQLPPSTKNRILSSIKQAQLAMSGAGGMVPNGDRNSGN